MSQANFDELFVGYPAGAVSDLHRQQFQIGIQNGIVWISQAQEQLALATLDNEQPLYDASGTIDMVTLNLVTEMPPKAQQAMHVIRAPFVEATKAYVAAAGQRRGLFKSGPTQQDLDDCKRALGNVMESLLQWYYEVNPAA